jgi:hypothetical protein
LDDFGPQQPRRAQPGDFHEEIGADRKGEADARGDVVDAQAVRLHGADVIDRRGQRESEFLRGAGAAVVVGAALHGDGLQLRGVGLGPSGELRHHGVNAVQIAGQPAIASQLAWM